MKRNKIIKSVLFSIFLFIISFFICNNVIFVSAVEISQKKDYSKFKWDEFYKNNIKMWGTMCDPETETCSDDTIKSLKEFYTRLYKILAEYQKKGYYIDDRVIVETVFFAVLPGEADPNSEQYKNKWSTDSHNFNYDLNTGDIDNEGQGFEIGIVAKLFGEFIDSIVSFFTGQEKQNYYEEETDTLKTLINNLVSVEGNCYKNYGVPLEKTDENGVKIQYCEEGKGDITKLEDKTVCATKVKTVDHVYTDYYLTSLSILKDKSFLPDLFPNNEKYLLNQPYATKDYDECKSEPDQEFTYYDNQFRVYYHNYWKFLATSSYFDNKPHLSSYYNELISRINEETKKNVECMSSTLCDNHIYKYDGLYEKYEQDIINVRKMILFDIMDSIYNYVKYDYSEEELMEMFEFDGFMAGNYSDLSNDVTIRRRYYWPIGSDETREENGRVFADKEPASKEIIRKDGKYFNELLNETVDHKGMDIKGIDENTNVVAVYDGEVYSIKDDCEVGDYSCNDGYGNQIIISHSNGDYTVYAHLSSILVTQGQSVLKGELIGKVGKTGAVDKPILHYEIRSGSPSIDHSLPMDDVSPDNPRPVDDVGAFDLHSSSMSREEFISKMQKYCNKASKNFVNAFCSNIETVYDVSVRNGVNPEFTVSRAMSEGFSPGGSSYNYWGIGCTNTGGIKACKTYSSLESGISGLASLGIVKNNQTLFDAMYHYAYIGKYWYKTTTNSNGKVNWGIGGCAYYPHIKQYMSSSRSSQVNATCQKAACTTSGGDCLPTNDEDQTAYTYFQLQKMNGYRKDVFGI